MTIDQGDQAPVVAALPPETLSELARIVLAAETLESVLAKIVALTRNVVAADEVSVTLIRCGRGETAAHTGDLAMEADERQYRLGSGPCLDAAAGGETLHIRDMRTEDRWPAYAKQAVEVGVLSALSIALRIEESILGAINIYACKADAFDERDIKAGEAFAAHAAIAAANAETYATAAVTVEQLRAAMESRATIEQAKGVLMAESGLSADEAFSVLVRASQRENRKLRDIAAELVARAQSRNGPTTPGPAGSA